MTQGMTGEIEAAGDAIGGRLLARAVEPHTGTAAHGAGGNCLNCGTLLVGPYCHACGQPEHIHRSLGAIWHDLAHGVFHFEGKIWQTLPMLAWRPGELTRRYIHGERARFVSPLALFLFSIFLMFAVINTFAGHLDELELDSAVQQTGEQLGAQIDIQRKAMVAEEGRLAAAKAAQRDTDALRADLDTRRAQLRELESSKWELSEKAISFSNLHTGWHALDKGIAKANANPGLALYKIQSNAYKYSWALIPISVPFVWLLFAWHRRRHIYDHTIFVTYSLAAMSLFAIVLTLLGLAGAPSAIITNAAVFLPPIHLYRQLRGAYEIGRWSAILRTFLLTIFAAIALTLFLMLLLSLGLLG